MSKQVSITQAGSTPYISYCSGTLEGFDPDYPPYSGSFEGSYPSEKVQIRPKFVSGPEINCMKINLTPTLPPGTWVRGTLTLTIAGYLNPISGEPSPWDGNAPNAVFLTKVGTNDITVRFDGSRGPTTLTQYWWVPVTEDGQEGFVLGVL